MGISGHSDNLGEFARESCSFIKVVNGENFEPRRSNHNLGLVNIGSRVCTRKYWGKDLL